MQSILRAFAADRVGRNRRVYLFERDREPALTPTQDVGAENYFYSDSAIDGSETLDDKITRYERRRLARILGALRTASNGASITQADAAELVSHLTLRSAHLRHSFANAGGALAEKAIDLFSQEATISGLLQAAGDADGSVMSQIIDRLLTEQPQLAALPLPRRVLEQMLRTFLDENREPVMRDLKAGVAVLRDALVGLDAAARAGHNAALAKTLGRTARSERLLAFQWNVERTGGDTLILPDCVALAMAMGSPDLQPLSLVDLDDVQVIVLPFGPRRLLVGRKTNDHLPAVSDLNRASALCSHAFFVSSVCTENLRQLSMRIGELNRGIIDTMVGRSVEEVRLGIQLPEREPVPSTADVVVVSPEPARQPADYRVTFRDCADAADANRLAEAVFAIVRAVSRIERLDRLDGITFAHDYAAALRELDRGFEATSALTTRSDGVGTGVAMAPAVLRSGVIKKHIVMRGGIAWGLLSEDEALRSQSMYILVFELMHVAHLQLVDEALPDTVLRPLRSPYEAILNAHVGGAPEAYFAARQTAPLFPGRMQELSKVACDALERAWELIAVQRRRYADDRNLDALAGLALTELGSFIQFAAELFGHCDGLGEDGAQARSALLSALRQRGLDRWGLRLHEELRRLCERCGKWGSYDEFLSLNRLLERVLWQFRIITWEVRDAPMYVLVLFD